jgi:hypothetical protein
MKDFEVGVKPIEGVGTSTPGFLGVAERGMKKKSSANNQNQVDVDDISDIFNQAKKRMRKTIVASKQNLLLIMLTILFRYSPFAVKIVLFIE